MNPNENEFIDSTIDTEQTVNEEVEVTLEDYSTDDGADDKDKLIATLKAQKDHWKKKATEKKDEMVKTDTKIVREEVKQDGLSQIDLIAIMRANVDEEDIQEIVDYAKLKNIPVSQALKTSVVKTILSEKAEERKTALATNTGKSKVSPSRASDESLLDKASKGELPEKDEDIQRLVKARIDAKRKS